MKITDIEKRVLTSALNDYKAGKGEIVGQICEELETKLTSDPQKRKKAVTVQAAKKS